jgi:fructose-bisphosphate aldolase class II
VSSGITKINVGTALNLAMTASLRDTLDADPGVTDPRRYLAPARLAMRETVLRILHEMR